MTKRIGRLKLTTEQFKKQAIELFGNQYDYSSAEYKGVKIKCIIICTKPGHGKFEQCPLEHLKGRIGCRKCLYLTTDKFIKESNIIHKNKYTYAFAEYNGRYELIKITCPTHGNFEQKAGYHLDGHGCHPCHLESRFSNTNEFIKKAKEIHEGKYDYSKVNYIKNSIPVIIICKNEECKAINNGEFKQKPEGHLLGNGCQRCGLKYRRYPKAITQNEFIRLANIKHNNTFDYSKTKYINKNTPVILICKNKHEYKQVPTAHLSGVDCAKCYHKSQCFSTEYFIERAEKIHNCIYDYSKSIYTRRMDNITIICKNKICVEQGKNEFVQTAASHLSGNGCPNCSSSKIESCWLDLQNIPLKNRNITIKINNVRFVVDGFIHETNTILEFYGDYWHGNPDIHNPEGINIFAKKTFDELYQKTINREKALKKVGYNIISIWEKDFKDWAKNFSIKWRDVSKEDLTPEALESLYKLSNINNETILKAA